MIGASVQGEVKCLTKARLSLAYQRVSFSVMSSLVVSSTVVATLWSTVDWQSLLTWLMTLWSVLLLRYVFARRFLKLNQDANIELAQWLIGFVIGAAATGLCWGLTVFYFPQTALDQTTVLLLSVLVGVCAFASVSMATIPMASTAFVVSSLLPAVLWLLSVGAHLPRMLAVMGLVYLGLMLLLSRQIHRTVLTSLLSADENMALTTVMQEQDRRMLGFFESAPGCYFTLQRDAEDCYSMPFASLGLVHILGIDPAVVRENINPLLQRIQPDDRECLLQELHQSAHRMTPCRIEFRVAGFTQNELWIALQCQPKEIGSGTVQWHGVMFDISQRKRLENELKQREAEFHTLADNLPAPVFRYDRDCRHIYVNAAAVQVTRSSPEQLLGNLPSDCVAVDLDCAAKTMESIREVIATGERRSLYVQYINSDESRSEYEGVLVPEFDADGRVISVLTIAHEVTSWREAERRSERYFSNMPGFAYTLQCSPDGRMSMPFASRGIEKIYGLRPEDVRDDATRLHAVEHPEDRSRIDAAGVLARQTLQLFRVEYRVQRLGHPLRWVESRSIPEQQTDGTLLWHGVMLDVTERKRMEDELADSRNFLNKVIDSISDPIFVKDKDHRWVLLNNAFCAMIGQPRDILIGKSDHDFLPKEQADVFWEKDELVFNSGDVNVNEEVITSADGSLHHLHTKKAPFVFSDGQRYIVAASRDITELKQTENVLRERETFLDSLINAIPIPVFYKDYEGRYLGFNTAYETFFGVPPDRLIGKNVFDTHPRELADIYHAKDVETFELRGKMQQYESQLQHADGTLRDVFFSKAAFLDSIGNVKGLIGAILDITERKHAERVLQENLVQITKLNQHLEEQAAELEASQVQLKNAYEFTEGVINAIPDILFEMDRDGRYLNVWTQNPQVLSIQKRTLLGKNIHNLLAPESAAIAMEGLREADAHGISYGKTIPIVQSNGETRWYEHSLAKKQCGPSSDATFIVLSRDVTERKHMEDELTQREREFRTLVDSLPDPFFRYDRDCRRTYVNAQVEKVTGKSAASLLGLTVAESKLAAPHWNAILERDIKQVLLTGQALDEELEYQAPDGKAIRYANRLGPVFDDNGEVSSVMLLMHDVTDIKASEQKLKDALEFSEGVINAIPDLLFEMDRDGRYLNIWTQKQELLATSKTEMLGRTVHEVLSPQSATILMEAIRETEEHGLSTGKVICIELPQGTHWFEHTVSRKAGVGADARFLMLSHDVTERKLAERALQENFEQITALNQHLEITARNLEEQASELEQSKQQLQLTEAWYRGILHSAPDGMLVVNGHGIITLVNAELCRMFGYGDTELIGQTIELLVPNRARADHVAKRQDFIASHSKASRMAGEASNLRGRCKNGSEFAVDVALSRLPDLNGNEGAICAAIRDVTEQQRLEKALAARELESRTLIENTPDSISRHDRNGAYIFVNQALADSIKGGITTMLGKKPTEIRPTDLSEIFEEKLSQVFTTGTNTEFELTWLDKRGNDMCYHIRLTAEFDASGAVATVLAVGRDITELNAYRQKIHQMAFYDTLTSLPNRALFNDRLRQMLTDALWHEQRAGVLLLDLDRFKAINDTMGHPAGDALLREAAARLTGCVRGYDTVARLGGDEFAILLPDIRAGDDLGRIASKILAAFNEPFMLEGKEVFVSTSIGIAVYPNDSADADELVKQADSAMYFAKRSGRNGFRFYSKDLTASAGERLSLESELRRALERKELELYYQPKVQLSNNQLIGSEALLRWNNPQRGMVPPDQFISIAEDSGLILEIGEWVLHNACRTACDWNAIGKPLHKVAINLSARQFQSNDLVETVRHALDATGCQPEWIELEITESLLLDEQGEVLEMLESFRVMGISVAIDDFGTGYSSLSYLARFPINTLKIDRSFIRTVTTEHFRAELVRAILSIARCLGQEVVAEGVETPEQAVFLREHGCQIAQGYLFSKPVPKAEFEAMSFTSAFSDETHLSAR